MPGIRRIVPLDQVASSKQSGQSQDKIAEVFY
jgi:hypothetical protein